MGQLGALDSIQSLLAEPCLVGSYHRNLSCPDHTVVCSFKLHIYCHKIPNVASVQRTVWVAGAKNSWVCEHVEALL